VAKIDLRIKQTFHRIEKLSQKISTQAARLYNCKNKKLNPFARSILLVLVNAKQDQTFLIL
jgi:hypothetical protein